MEIAFEITGMPDINEYDSYRVRIPDDTCVAEIVTYGMCNLKNFKVSTRRGAFERNNVLVEFKNEQLCWINQHDLSEIQSRLCKSVTAYSGCATLEFVVELSDHKAVMEQLNYFWKRIRKKIIMPIKA